MHVRLLQTARTSLSSIIAKKEEGKQKTVPITLGDGGWGQDRDRASQFDRLSLIRHMGLVSPLTSR